MRYSGAAGILTCVIAGCSSPATNSSDRTPANKASATPTVAAVQLGPTPVHTWLDPQAARQIMSARSDFDAAEAAALAELDRTVGAYRDVMMITREQYRRQLASAPARIARSDAWRREQQKRAAYAYHILQPKIDAARQ